ncbi:auxin transporter-like protein 2 [Sesbania bispinosa]|nr:auxin transporter-like protein 2 [Sesbania bispinosa]
MSPVKQAKEVFTNFSGTDEEEKSKTSLVAQVLGTAIFFFSTGDAIRNLASGVLWVNWKLDSLFNQVLYVEYRTRKEKEKEEENFSFKNHVIQVT